jgi:hypothetical protein
MNGITSPLLGRKKALTWGLSKKGRWKNGISARYGLSTAFCAIFFVRVIGGPPQAGPVAF